MSRAILLVKLSSLGDVVHNLPVVSDVAHALPDAVIDWLVDEQFIDVPRLHPRLRRAIGVPLRALKRNLLSAGAWRTLAPIKAMLRETPYHAIIDTQGLVKSAWLARWARGPRHGFDRTSAREPLAATLYHHTHAVPREQHAVERNRALAAQALGYAPATPVGYGIGRAAQPTSDEVVFLHATSRADKLWPEEHWIALGRALSARGLRVVLPWGNEVELARSQRIAAALASVLVPDRVPIAVLATQLAAARAVIGVDTGLVHLATALGTPTLAIYCGSDPALTGVYGSARALNLGTRGVPPSVDNVLAALERVSVAS